MPADAYEREMTVFEAEEEVRTSESMPNHNIDVMDGGPAYESSPLHQHQMRSSKLHVHCQDTFESHVSKTFKYVTFPLLAF